MKIIKKIQKKEIFFSDIEKYRDIYGLFIIPLHTLVLLFIFYVIFS
jgi:hypothetical protein